MSLMNISRKKRFELQQLCGVSAESLTAWIDLYRIKAKDLQWFTEMVDNKNFDADLIYFYIKSHLPLSEQMMEWLAENRGVSLSDCANDDLYIIKSMNAQIFKEYVNSRIGLQIAMKDPTLALANKLGYAVLRHSTKKTEIDYVRKVFSMRKTHLRKAVLGGKLFNISKQYIDSPLKDKFIA